MREKVQETKSQLGLTLNVIGCENGASFLDQSHSEGTQNQGYSGLFFTTSWELYQGLCD